MALDIGTEYVKALIGKVGLQNNVEIIGVGRQHQNLSDMQAGACGTTTQKLTGKR